MPRDLPKEWRDRAVPGLDPRPDKPITQVREYELITPLFGGGVETQQADPVTVVRASELRGQLRFWWRATRGGQFGGSLEKMKAAEDALWGSSASFDQDGKPRGGPSQVQVTLLDWHPGEADVPFVVEGTRAAPRLNPRPGTSVPSYAAFPLQPKRDDQAPEMQLPFVQKKVRFKLQLSFPDLLRPEIESALWAWETFGGLGGRTRRGFGALRLLTIDDQPHTDLPPVNEEQCRRWLQKRLPPHEQHTCWPNNVPCLPQQVRYKLVIEHDGSSLTVWKQLIERLQKFRQRRRNKNTFQIDSYGHSDWPEPNAIRRARSKITRGPHASRIINKYPRAQFGLPIIFHMPHDDSDTTLQGAENNQARLASPLILKPLACRDNKAIGLALILEGVNLPAHLTLRDVSSTVDPYLTQVEANLIPPLSGNVDVLQAFLNTL